MKNILVYPPVICYPSCGMLDINIVCFCSKFLLQFHSRCTCNCESTTWMCMQMVASTEVLIKTENVRMEFICILERWRHTCTQESMCLWNGLWMCLIAILLCVTALKLLYKRLQIKHGFNTCLCVTVTQQDFFMLKPAVISCSSLIANGCFSIILKLHTWRFSDTCFKEEMLWSAACVPLEMAVGHCSVIHCSTVYGLHSSARQL